MVVQRHNAASKSTSPSSTGQQVSLALLPIPICIRPPNKSTHAPSFRVSMGQVCCAGDGGGHSGGGGGGGGGHGVSVGGAGGFTGTGDGIVTIGGGGGVMVGGFGT